MIRVVAAEAIDRTNVDGPVVARTRRLVEVPTLAGLGIDLVHTYDDLLENPEPDTAERIAADLMDRGASDAITYLVSALPGDTVVERLDHARVACAIHGSLDRDGFGLGKCLIVDALEIALAELQAPFDRGYLALEPSIPLVVTNWYGDKVSALATRRLSRLYGIEGPVGRVRDLELLVPPVERLEPIASLSELEHIVARLRRPDGCPWDRDQTSESLLTQFVDELDEFAEAVSNGDIENQREELGDVLFHVVAQCQLAAEAGDFSMDDVLREITAKLVRRHPHVFGDVQADTYDDVLATWNRVKAEEKSAARRTQK